jgi:hypothetical protein
MRASKRLIKIQPLTNKKLYIRFCDEKGYISVDILE